MSTAAERTRLAWDVLADVADPELPVLSVVDLGIVRAVDVSDAGTAVAVTLTPTYSGCPATEVIAASVRSALSAEFGRVELRTQLSPAWTTDWLTDAGRRKLHAFGIVPPADLSEGRPLLPIAGGVTAGGATSAGTAPAGTAPPEGRPDACPRCGAQDPELLAAFGSTPCKALFRCRSCREPFDYLKRH